MGTKKRDIGVLRKQFVRLCRPSSPFAHRKLFCPDQFAVHAVDGINGLAAGVRPFFTSFG